MRLKFFKFQSLKTRATLEVLLIFIAGIWSLSFYASQMLRQDMEQLLGKQQRSTASILAAQINFELENRLSTLSEVAQLSSDAFQRGPAAIQSFIDQRPDLHLLFNGGTYVTRSDGVAIADYPPSAGRIGVNYSDREYISTPLQKGRAVIGQPVMGKKAQTPVIVIGAPIKNTKGEVIGALTGVINLDMPNFLHQISENNYGQTGGYILISRAHRLIVTATEKNRTMNALQAPGKNLVMDRYQAGEEGSAVYVNSRGVEMFSSAQNIPVANWYLIAVLPTSEAFAPIREMQQRVLLATILLTLLAGVLTWWMLRRQLLPLLTVAKTLATQSDSNQPLQPLPIARQDEIGLFIGGFNHLLATLGERENALKESEDKLAITLHSINDAVIATDLRGRVTLMNPTAEQLTGWSLAEALEQPLTEVFRIINEETRTTVSDPVQLVLARGLVVGLSNHTVLLSRDGNEYQISDNASPMRNSAGEIIGVVMVFRDVSEKHRMEQALRESHETLQSILATTQDGYWRINAQSQLLDVNSTYCHQSGFTRHELLKMNISDLEALKNATETDALIHLILKNGSTQFETCHRRKDGSIWHVEVSATCRNQSSGEMIVFTRDISERKQAEEALRKSSESFRDFFEKNTSVLLLTDPASGAIIDANQAASDYYGYQAAQLIRMNISEINTMPAELIAQERQRAMRGDRKTFLFVHRLASGVLRDVEVHLTPIENGGRTLLFCIIHDITERKQAEEKLFLAASVFTHAREGILITTTDGSIIDVNHSFSRITGYQREEVLGRNPRILSSGRQEKEFYEDLWCALHEKGHWYGEVWNRRKNGEVFASMQTISTVNDAQGNARHFVALFADITAIKEHEKQLEHIAHYDVLTTLPNRVLLADRLQQAMAQAQRRGQLLAVAYLDLDGFKAINDLHGHQTGDQLLITLAERMKQSLRDSDTLARLGGDEFVAVLSDLDDIAACVPMLSRLLAAAAQPMPIGESILQVSASLGVAFYPQSEPVDADQLLRQADQAMYQAKLSGKNRYHIFDAEQDRSVRGHHESLEHIRHALETNQFVLHYQPKVNMRTGEVIGAEALIRWQHPQRGLLPPAVFLPVIENHPLAVTLGEWVIESALSQMERWRNEGLDIPVSVNVSARQLQQMDFVGRLHATLAAHPAIRPGDLEIEVLETSALEDLARVSSIIEECQSFGVSFSLDDFGTGYSSLTYLKHLSVGQLKIDQSFVRNML
ncbi:MAG: PAS domain S-box protein, partial [Betaproteobacteria bacterium]